MNKKRMIALAEHLEKPETAEHFDMLTYFNLRGLYWEEPVGKALKHCGTSACIAGWAVALFEPEVSRAELGDRHSGRAENSVYYEARQLLDLTNEQAKYLFTANLDQSNLEAAAAVWKMAK